ncbi:M23 family metallopeptidase [Aequorivita flava]|uniref:M23 family metallopeptidase n=1 Tax=Aequorivita flava TaxID=3114371 RepID=A0AB35YQQ5_9FLAO
MFLKSKFILLLATLALFYSCNENEPHNDPYDLLVALPTAPVKVANTSGTWLVYEMHIKVSSLQKVEIFNNNNLQLSYTDFITRDDFHLASIWLQFPPQGWTDDVLAHQFYYKDSTGTAKQHTFNLKLAEQFPDPITIAFPVPEGIWLAEAAASPTSYHTRAIFPYPEPVFDPTQQGYLIGNNPQRYAIDYAKLVDGLPYQNDGSQLEDWYCYNLPILASQGGKVIFTENNIPDNLTPGELDYTINASNITGNVVYIEHDDGSIGTYCHLIPNTILVEVGDLVTTGQELGRLGNSGNSFAPHLHMHLLTNPEGKQILEYVDGLFFESLPYKFAQFTKLGHLPPGYLDQPPLTPFTPTTNQVYTDVLPSESDVIEF